MKRNFYFLLLGCLVAVLPFTGKAQSTTVTWPYDLGTADQVATFTSGTESLFSANSVTMGTNLTLAGAKTYSDSVYTSFQPLAQSNTPSEIDLVSFNLKTASGKSFTPQKVSMNIRRFGTDGGLLNIVWKSAGTRADTIAVGILPARNKAGSTGINYVEYDLSSKNIPAATGDCALEVFIYALGNTKQVGLAKVEIQGTFGTGGAANQMKIGAELVETQYFNLAGRRLQAPEKGITIIRSIYKDGSTVVTKSLF